MLLTNNVCCRLQPFVELYISLTLINECMCVCMQGPFGQSARLTKRAARLIKRPAYLASYASLTLT